MADITHEELMQRLGRGGAATGIEPTPPVAIRPERDPLSRTLATGEIVPLDTASGVPFLTRLNVATAPDPAVKQRILEQSFAGARVEPVPGSEDEFVIRGYVDPASGQEKDILVDERAATLKDIADLGGIGAELLGAYAAMRGGRGFTQAAAPGFARTLMESALAGAGSQAVRAAEKVVTRAETGTPVQPLDIWRQAQLGTAAETALGTGVGVGILGATRFLNLRRGVSVTPEAEAAVLAAQRLSQATGTSIPLTQGQRTGSTRLLESEEFLQRITFGGGPQRAARQLQEARVGQTQEALMREAAGGINPADLPTTDVLGRSAVQSLRQLANSMDVPAARDAALTEATRDLSAALDTAVGPISRTIYKQEAGDAITTFSRLKQDALNEVEDQLGDEVDRLVGNQPFIPTPAAKQRVSKIVQEAYGKPGAAEAGELLESMPSSLRPILRDIMALPGQVNLTELRRLQRSVNRQISQGQILGDTDTGVLKQIGSILTDARGRGAEANLSAEAATALRRFNQFYSEGISHFETKGIEELLADPTQRKLGPEAVFRAAVSSPDQYFRVKQFLTEPLKLEGAAVGPVQAGNQTWDLFKQAMLADMEDSARLVGNLNRVDPKALLTRFQDLDKKVADDFFGANKPAVFKALQRLNALNNPKLPAEEALDLLRQGGDNLSDDLLNLARVEKAADDFYSNSVIKRFVKGDVPADRIEAGEFVARLSDADPLLIDDVLSKLAPIAPETVKQIRGKVVQDLFQRAADNPFQSEVAARKLAKEIRTPEQQARLKALLGPQNLALLNDFTGLLGHVQRATDTAVRTGGSMAGGSERKDLITLTRLVVALPRQAQYWFIGKAIADPRFGRMLTGPVKPLDPTKTIRAAILTQTALTDLASTFGDEAVGVFNSFMNLEAQPAGAQPGGDISHEELMRRLQR